MNNLRDAAPSLEELVQMLKGLSAADMRELRDLLARGAEDEPPPFEGRPNTGGTIEGERRRAETEVAPVLAASDCLALDSADEIYRAALARMGVNASRVHASGLRTLYQSHRARHRYGAGNAPLPRVAMDGAAAKSFAERFPGADKIQVM